MARRKSRHPTELELEILKVLWEESPLTVKQVRQVLADRFRTLAHTSLITTLNVMFDKGYVLRESVSEGKGYEFSPKLSREEVSQGMVGDLVARMFGGSASALMLSLLESDQLNADEHSELKSAIERYRRGERK
ncbi:BlaI/MecI/CopY family transcriptional regulator [Haloferula chungangensis]|uniref:BlaI/MecI/CopY family transcriptional regulator n=1 Tax=Haloferula chungangensis TaxID=1048331 RepID=A0ABW2L7U6_9BACT